MGRKMIYIYIYIYMFGWKEAGGKARDDKGRKEKKIPLFVWREMEWGKGNREKRESVLEHEDFFFLSFLPCKLNTSNAR